MYQEYRIIGIDIVNPSFQHWTAITKNTFSDFDVHEDLLVIISKIADEPCLIDIRRMSNPKDGPEEGVMMVLDPVMVSVAPCFCCMRQVTISSFM